MFADCLLFNSVAYKFVCGYSLWFICLYGGSACLVLVFGFGLLVYFGVVLILGVVWAYGDGFWFVVSFVDGCRLAVY